MRLTGLVLAFTLLAGAALAHSYPLNEQPMFGGQPKTPEMLAADQQLFASTEKFGYTRAQGSDKSVQLGWQYLFQKHDIATAMKRFNQAWLLDPDNGDVFHGFALLVMSRDHDAVQAASLFEQGIAKPRQSPGIYLDYGRFLLTVNRPADAVPQLRKALSFPTMGPDAEALLTLALYQSGEKEAACAESAKVQDGAQAATRDAARAICTGR
jgi:Tfp pilus assembly protein PilF